MGERIEVEVECPECGDESPGFECRNCCDSLVVLKPDSLAARQIALAVAVDRERVAWDQWYFSVGIDKATEERWRLRKDELDAALAAVRAHPMYRRPE